MAAPRRKPSRPHPSVVRRSPGEAGGMRQLPPNIEDLAAGRSEYLRTERKPQGRIHDDRIGGLVPGVPNFEARQVLDARVEQLREAVKLGDDDHLARLLHEATLLRLWRARNVQGLEALCEGVLGLNAERGRELAAQGLQARGGEMDRLPDVAVALWVRSEAALLEHGPGATVEVWIEGDALKLTLGVPLAKPERAADALNAIGRKAKGLGEVLVPGRKPPQRMQSRGAGSGGSGSDDDSKR